MMREAVQNERLASDQRLMEAYQTQLESAVDAVQDRWAVQLLRSHDLLQQRASASAFAEIVSRANSDSVLILDQAGNLIYPEPSQSYRPSEDEDEPRWDRAHRLEFVDHNFDEAAAMYETLSVESTDDVVQARCRQAQVRCLLALDRPDLAIRVLQNQRRQPQLRDRNGRSFAAAAEMRLLELLDRDTPNWQEVAKMLALRLNSYGDDSLSSSQRLFLMNRLNDLTNHSIDFPTHAAEALANQAALVDGIRLAKPLLQASSITDVWCRASRDGRIIELYRTATLRQCLLKLAEENPLPRGVAFKAIPPNESPSQESSSSLMDVSLGSDFGGWRLGLSVTSDNLIDEISRQRRAIHVGIALAVVALTCVLAWLLSDVLRRRLRLATLKNHLVATVSHELKTPLASIRLLVDTLLHDEKEPTSQVSSVQRHDYLQLISHENARLTRMIDNFLTFSRLERGKANTDFQIVDIQDIVDQAATAFCERTENVEGALHIHHGTPAMVSGDADSLITAVVNLLDNAWKYSDDPRQIIVTTKVEEAQIAIAVSDNGIGMNARALSQAFERFFQVDQRVERTRGGCGLGLSIVRAIVQSHGGDVRVESEPNRGSTFTLIFPKAVEVMP